MGHNPSLAVRGRMFKPWLYGVGRLELWTSSQVSVFWCQKSSSCKKHHKPKARHSGTGNPKPYIVPQSAPQSQTLKSKCR